MSATPARILVVEDERIVARDIQRRLTRSGYDVVGVTGNGDQAADLARTMRPDLVLMDIHLEGNTDGVTAAEAIRADTGAPIVYLTAYADDHTLQRARVTEPFGYILKPFEERELRTVIEMALYRHESERRLRESEHRYAVTLGSIGDAVIATDERGVVTFMNAIAESLTGWRADDARGQALDEVYRLESETTGAPLHNPVARVLRDGVVLGLADHSTLVSRDGRRIPVDDSAAPIRVDGSSPLGAVLVFHDISERRRAERAIRDAEQKFRSIFENAVEGIFQLDADGRLLTANPALARICGQPSAEGLLGSGIELLAALCPDVDRRAALQRELAEQGVVKGFVTELERGDGSRVWVSLSIRLVGAAATGGGGFEGSLEEITERIRLEQQVRQSQKMEAIGRLAGGVAHDFNNMLTVILSSSELLLRDRALPATAREDIAMIRSAAESAATLTRQLLLFGRKQAHAPVAVDLNRLVGAVERMLGRVIGENIELRADLEEAVWPVHVDPVQMEQVLVNLAVNARDAMADGGRLRISTANAERTAADALADPDIPPGRYVVLQVEDSGSGMDAATRARLFEPFFTTKDIGKGTGLGLATVYSIIEQSAGRIRVASELGAGTTFTLWLPASSAPAVASRDPAVEPGAHGDGATVLVVDDDASIRRLTRRVLEQRGFIVLEAAHGREALELCRRHTGPLHLVLTDVVMPEMGGIELGKHLRAERPDLPLLYMSGYVDVPDRGAMRGGPDELVTKPFTPDELAERVQKAVARGAAGARRAP